MWHNLNVSPQTLRLRSLICGQTFRWINTGHAEYTSTIQNQIVTLKETEETIYFCLGNDVGHGTDTVRGWLVDYFRLDLDIEPHFRKWCAEDPLHFQRKLPRFPGLRMIKQPPFECLCSFICSSNNHIARITTMVQNLSTHFGKRITSSVEAEKENKDALYRDREWYSFPEPAALVESEAKLRDLGFGYRAKYIQETARRVVALGGEAYLYGLRKQSYADAHAALLTFAGVGPKVGDCVALSGLDHLDAVPVDVHVLRIATRDYGFRIPAGKSLTLERYQEAGDLFRRKFGPLAGWAQLILFSAELRQFKGETPTTVEKVEDAALVEEETGRIKLEKNRIKVESEMEENVIASGHVTLKRRHDVIHTDEKGRVVRRSFRNVSVDMTKSI